MTPSGIASPAAAVSGWHDQDGTLRNMWLSNQPPSAIAEALGRSVAAIMTRAARLGLPRRAAPGRKPGRRLMDEGGASIVARSNRRPPKTPTGDATQKGAMLVTSLRICLMCLNKFESSGKHNRICSSCKNSAEYETASALPEIHIPAS
ncbi:MAG: hypothetical protein SFW62_01935 [Alphaproteobacteria bacterium]|nr:hypothetical protein [Alphaproteobacteria bacterium]